MICILHGWLLEGSGSNLWTRSIVRSLCRTGETVHLMCQENHGEMYDFICEVRSYRLDGSVEILLERKAPYSGKCILHKPELGETLPVFVWDKYEEYERVVPMVDLADSELETYIRRNVEVLKRIVGENAITAIHANHAVLMSVVAQRVKAATGVPYSVMPHGSDIEYAVKKDERFLRYASDALADAGRIFVIGDEMRARVDSVFRGVPGLEEKCTELHLGVDTSQFETVAQDRRPELMGLLRASLDGMPRGKAPSQSDALRREISAGMSDADFLGVLRSSGRYDAKKPDHDVEEKLLSVDWERASTILFVGRLIAAKGVQSILAALPLVLAQHPGARLIVVGHGPLREPMEAFLWALQTGQRSLVERIVAHGRSLEGDPSGRDPNTALTEARTFYDTLEARGDLDGYFEIARAHVGSDTVVFTGYLTHAELRYLFPCCDVGVFPSVVREAGPLVFLEALASGCFPLGTYFGGMAASIDTLASELPPEAISAMKLDPASTAADLAKNLPVAIGMSRIYGETLSRIARERYDWTSVAGKFRRELAQLGSAGKAIGAL